ncbi:MAG: hemin uptake protein HemP [Acetobacteraceae bacterium]
MNQQGQQATATPSQPAIDHRTANASTVNSEELFGGGRELMIRHADSVYRLKITGSNKLILTK